MTPLPGAVGYKTRMPPGNPGSPRRARRATAHDKTQWLFASHLRDRARRRVWLPKDQATEIPYAALQDSHLANILLMLRRLAQQKAQMAADALHLDLGPSGWLLRKHPQWDGLVEEAKRRGGQVASAAQLIDSRDPVDADAIRAAVGRGP